MLATLTVSLALVSTASADLGRIVVLGDSLAAGTRLGPQVPGSILSCGRSTGSYPQLALSRMKKSAAVDVSCNGGHAGVFSSSWTGMPANPPQHQYNDGTTIPPQYNSLNGSEQVVIIGSGGNEAYFGDSLYTCLGHSEDYDLNKCAQEFGANGAGLLARTQGSKTIMAGVLDAVHQRSPNAKIFLVGTPRIAPPDGIGCHPNPILTLADAPVWSVWEDSLRQAMSDIVSTRSSYARFVDVQAVSGNTHSACAEPNMKWMNNWITENVTYPGLANHNTPWGADAIADIIVNAIKASGLNTGTPNAPTLTRTTVTASPNQTFTYSGAVGSTFKCRLDNAAYTACPSSPLTLTGLTDGPHTYSITQTDGSGNVSPGTIVNFSVDTVAPGQPTLTRTSPTASPTKSQTQTFIYSGAEPGGTFQCKLDSAAYAACPASPATIGGLTTGSHTYYVTQTDAAGNVSPARSVQWTVDATPPGLPTVTRTNPSADPTKSPTQIITYAGAESGGTFQCKLDSGNFAPCSGSPITLTGLGAGTHTYSVTQTDAVGNVGSATTVTWTIDLTPPGAPTVTRTNPAATPTNSTTQTITYSGAESGGTFQCKLDDSAYVACPASPITLSGLGAGSHVVSVTQTDAAGNVSATAGTVSWTVDMTPPPVPNVSGPSGTTALNTATINYSNSEPGVSFKCKLDTAAYANCAASPISLSGLSAGSHTYYVTATDAAGNVSNPGTASWTVDSIGFTTSITANPSNPSTSSSATFSFAASVTAGTTYQCKLDSGAFSSCTSPKTYNGLTDGSHTFTVRANNASTSPTTTPEVSRAWVIDATPPGAPTLSRTSPTATPTNSPSQTFSLTPAEAGGVLTCKLDNGAASTCPSSPITVTGLGNAQHTFTVTQTDAAGNTGSAASVTWTVDTIAPNAPTVTRTAPTATQANSTSQTITYSGLEPGATTQCKLDTGAYGSCSASGFTLNNLGQGSHTFSMTQTDAAGNTSSPSSVTWSIDSIAPAAPSLIRDVPTATLTNSASQTLSFSAAESGGTLNCKLDAAAYSTCQASPITLTGLTNGQHTFSVTQTDATGNTSQPTSVTWTVDLIAPLTVGPIGFDRPAITNHDSATIGYTPKEAGGTVQCQIDFGPWSPCASNPLLLTNLNDGNHNVAIRQVDDAGNIGAGAQVAWLVDTVKPDAPTVTRTSPATSPSNQTSASISFVPAELTGTLLCKLDGGSYSACRSSPVSMSNLSLGTHTFSVTQTDAAGNVSLVGSTTWTVDNVPLAAPTVTRTTPTGNPTSSTTQTITYSGEAGASFQCKRDLEAYAPCASSPVTITGLADGTHTYSVRQTDAAGNLSSVATVTWVVDLTPPPTPTVSGPSGTSGLTSATITYSNTEPGVTFQCKLDSNEYGTCAPSPITLTGLANGTHTYFVTASDAAGNVSAAGTASWTVDPSSFGVEITSAPGSLSKLSTASFEFESAGPTGTTYECKLDTGTFEVCTSPMNYSGLTDGSHTFTVQALNGSGTTSGAGHTWVIDATLPAAPTVTRSNPSATPTSSTVQTLSFFGAEAGGELRCSLNDSVFVTCPSSPVELSAFIGQSLPDGTYDFSVQQTDSAGNTGPPASVAWVVDTTAPAAPGITRSNPSESPTSSTTQSITYSGEPGASFECRLDSGSYAPCSASPVTLAGLSLGSHSFSVRQIDGAGNASTDSAVAWTIEPPAPPVTPVLKTLSAKISAVSPKSIKPAKKGPPFSLKSRGSVGSFRVTLAAAATVSVRLERVKSGRSRASTTWSKFKLKSGRTKIHLSGRAKKRALPAGTYRVRLVVGGAKPHLLGKSFRIKR